MMSHSAVHGIVLYYIAVYHVVLHCIVLHYIIFLSTLVSMFQLKGRIRHLIEMQGGKRSEK